MIDTGRGVKVGIYVHKTCSQCGEVKNRYRDFFRWSTRCHICLDGKVPNFRRREHAHSHTRAGETKRRRPTRPKALPVSSGRASSRRPAGRVLA